jgi:hypothetical protein
MEGMTALPNCVAGHRSDELSRTNQRARWGLSAVWGSTRAVWSHNYTLGKRPHIFLMENPILLTLITDSECSNNVEIEANRDLASFVLHSER